MVNNKRERYVGIKIATSHTLDPMCLLFTFSDIPDANSNSTSVDLNSYHTGLGSCSLVG